MMAIACWDRLSDYMRHDSYHKKQALKLMSMYWMVDMLQKMFGETTKRNAIK